MKKEDALILILLALLLWKLKGSAEPSMMYQDPDTGEWLPAPLGN